MISKEILKKIKKIEITTRHLVNTVLLGEYLSSFKGKGIEFAEVREYAEGDDVRSIDWNVSARMNAPFVKTFVEERELQVIFAADMSSSLNFGSNESLKNELMFEFVSALGFTANMNNDRVGFLGFTTDIEKYIAAKKGRKHILRIVREILYHDQKSKGTDISKALMYLNHLLKKRSTIFLISDFYDKKDFYDALKVLKFRHDVIAVILRDHRDYDIPEVGLIPFYDGETGKTIWFDTSDRKEVKRYEKASRNTDAKIIKTFRSLGVDHMTLYCGEPYINDLITFFKKRERRMVR